MSKHEEKPAAGDDKPKAKGGSFLNLILIGVFMLVVIGVECAIASFMIPSAEEVAEMAEARMSLKDPPMEGEEEAGHDEAAHGEEAAGDHGDAGHGAEADAHGGGHGEGGGGPKIDANGEAEVKLGEYTVTAHQPTTNSTIRIDFKLYGIVLGKNLSRFDSAYHASEHRFRDQVLSTVRNSEIADLTDPSLGLLKRRILEKSNRLMGKSLLKSVVFSDFSFIEQ